MDKLNTTWRVGGGNTTKGGGKLCDGLWYVAGTHMHTF